MPTISSRVRRGGLFATSLLSICLGVLAVGGSPDANAAQDDPTDPAPSATESTAGPEAVAPEPIYWSKDNVTVTSDVDARDELTMPARFYEAAAGAAGLADWNDDDFADSYYDPTRERVMIVPVTDVGTSMAKEFVAKFPDLVDIAPGLLSHADLKDAGRKLIDVDPFLSEHAFELAVSHGSHGIDISIDRLTVDFAYLAATVEPLPFNVTFIVNERTPVPGDALDEDRREDTSPYSGGMGFIGAIGNNPEARCSAGFGYREGSNDFMLTAGHCFARTSNFDRMYIAAPGTDWENVNTTAELGEYAGDYNGRSSWHLTDGSVQVNGAFHGDVSLVNVSSRSHGSGDRMWDGGAHTTNKETVKYAEAPFVGEFLCLSAAAGGSTCGTLKVKGVNVDTQLPSPFGGSYWLREHDRARAENFSECSESGDSGGSVYSSATGGVAAVGIISGHDDYSQDGGYCIQRFTGTEEAVQAWGGFVKQN